MFVLCPKTSQECYNYTALSFLAQKKNKQTKDTDIQKRDFVALIQGKLPHNR